MGEDAQARGKEESHITGLFTQRLLLRGRYRQGFADLGYSLVFASGRDGVEVGGHHGLGAGLGWAF